ncbi:MAG: DnaB-like helicase C-terminal domain-containing protein [Phycisphaerales bacterium]
MPAIVAALGLDERALFADDAGGRALRGAPAPPPARSGADAERARPPRRFPSAREAAAVYRHSLGTEAARWVYRAADGSPAGLVLRWNRPDGSKVIRPAWKVGEAWEHTYPAVRPLYALDRLAADRAARVFVAEGEKCAEALAELGLLATTSPGGANAAERAEWAPLAGREVVVLPDADDAGRTYAEAVLARLAALEPPARAVVAPLPGLAAGEDAVEFVGRVHGGDRAAARKGIEDAAAAALAGHRPARVTLSELLADSRLLARPETLESGWTAFDRAQPFGAVERGAIVLLAAPPGCYKTATMLRLARGYAECGHRVAWLAAEMQPLTLARRMVCQLARLAPRALLSDAMPPDHAARLAAARARLAECAGRMEFTSAPIGFAELERAAERAAVVFVDYLQLVRHPDSGTRGHERIEDIMGAIAAAAQRTGAVFVLASAQGRDGGEARRGIHNAARGSSSIEFTSDALYTGTPPEPGNPRVVFECLKQREGERFPIEVPIDPHTGAIAEEGDDARS